VRPHNKKIYQIPNQCELPASQIREIKYAIRTAVAIFSVRVMGSFCFISWVMRFTSNDVLNVSSLTIYMKTRMIVNPSLQCCFSSMNKKAFFFNE